MRILFLFLGILLFTNCSHSTIIPDMEEIEEEIEEPSPDTDETIQNPDITEEIVYYGNKNFPDTVRFNNDGGTALLKPEIIFYDNWYFENLYLEGKRISLGVFEEVLSNHPDWTFLKDLKLTIPNPRRPYEITVVEYKWFKLSKIDTQTMRVQVYPSDTARTVGVETLNDFLRWGRIEIIQE